MSVLDCYTQDAVYSYYEKQITGLLERGRKTEAQEKAFEWLQEYADSLGISVPWNWKIAKKQIVACFYGKIPSMHLYCGDSMEKGIRFLRLHADKNIRCSFHRADVACHSESRRITIEDIEWLAKIRDYMSQRDVIDIFIESSSESARCFRRFSLSCNEEVSYEMGYGQAMHVFEAERGLHDVVGQIYRNGKWQLKNGANFGLLKSLEQLIENHDRYLAIKAHCICYYFGIPQISIEGYFDTGSPFQKPVIVDIDLPFDKAFF